jgi:hypothetical protein
VITSGVAPARQIDRVRWMLADWCCAVDFVNAEPPILAYCARIFELRRQGFVIERRRCESPYHQHRRRSSLYQWSIVARPGEPVPLPGVGRD